MMLVIMAVGIVSLVVEFEVTLSLSFIDGKDNSTQVKGMWLPAENCNACINGGD